MLQVGLDISQREMPDFVRENLTGHMSYVHLSGIDFADLEPTARNERIRSISSEIGSLTLSNGSPDSDIWPLDSKTSPNGQLVAGHTDNPFRERPEDIVAFWNVRSSSKGGENVITPFPRIVRLAEQSQQMAELILKAYTKVIEFKFGDQALRGTLIDYKAKTLRYDAKSIAPEDNEFEPLFEEVVKVGDKIKLKPGEVLFFNNRRTIHARLPYSDPNRLSIRTRMVV